MESANDRSRISDLLKKLTGVLAAHKPNTLSNSNVPLPFGLGFAVSGVGPVKLTIGAIGISNFANEGVFDEEEVAALTGGTKVPALVFGVCSVERLTDPPPPDLDGVGSKTVDLVAE